IAWIKEKIPNSAEHIKKKLPSMYHQFKQLADIDITVEPMEVGPTTHYAMGGIRVDGDSQMSTTVPGLFAAGEVAAGLHGANRLGGNSLSDLLVFGKRAGEYAARFAREGGAPEVHADQVEEARREALAAFEREGGESPYKIQQDLQEMMQAKVGIIREEKEMLEAIDGIEALKARAAGVSIDGNRHYNPGWHTAVDLKNLLVCAEAVARCAVMRKESRGAQARADYPDKDPEWGKFNLVVKKGRDGRMEVRKEPVVPIREDLQKIIEEQQK
ncbi:MAG TPA: FAD-binding protein, partial [Kofleriaceae bacterium]|nr:FAD-binding protein [Kofleriaceae bacterium]